MIDKLSLFSIGNFSYIKDYYSSSRKAIVSIREFFVTDIFDCVNKHNDTHTVIDISYLCNIHDKLQSIGENLLAKLSEYHYEYICDVKYSDVVRTELRFCFVAFEIWEETHTLVNNDGKNCIVTDKHKKITDLRDDEFKAFISTFRESLYGHDRFKDEFSEALKSFRVFNALGEHRVFSLFLLGESGVGKTEVARAIYKSMGGKRALAKVNFGNYSNEFSLSSLIGSARGYVGSDDGEIFIRVRNTDIGVILIDEFEKSNATLFNFFLDVLESGKMVSSQAEELDINGFIIVFTSNITKEDFPKRISPELRSRFDYKGRFIRLYDEDKIKYIEFRVKSIVKKYNEVFNDNLNESVLECILSKIVVSQYHNMRNINKRIKSEFLKYLDFRERATPQQKSKIKSFLQQLLPD